MKFVFLFLIRLYQQLPRSFFLIEKGSCRFSPTCSRYCYQAIESYGTIRGLTTCVKRILKCNSLRGF